MAHGRGKGIGIGPTLGRGWAGGGAWRWPWAAWCLTVGAARCGAGSAGIVRWRCAGKLARRRARACLCQAGLRNLTVVDVVAGLSGHSRATGCRRGYRGPKRGRAWSPPRRRPARQKAGSGVRGYLPLDSPPSSTSCLLLLPTPAPLLYPLFFCAFFARLSHLVAVRQFSYSCVEVPSCRTLTAVRHPITPLGQWMGSRGADVLDYPGRARPPRPPPPRTGGRERTAGGEGAR